MEKKKYVIALDQEQQAQDVFYLTDRDIYAVSVRGSFLRFTLSRDGLNMTRR